LKIPPQGVNKAALHRSSAVVRSGTNGGLEKQMAKRKKGLPVVAEADAAKSTSPDGELKLASSPEEFTDLGRENLAAIWRSSAALSEALEALNQEVIDHLRSSFAAATSTATSLLGAKTLEEVFRLNADFARVSMVGLIEGTAKLSEIGVKFANEAFVPWGGRLEATMQRLAKPLPA
jgi:hypothetical protein